MQTNMKYEHKYMEKVRKEKIIVLKERKGKKDPRCLVFQSAQLIKRFLVNLRHKIERFFLEKLNGTSSKPKIFFAKQIFTQTNYVIRVGYHFLVTMSKIFCYVLHWNLVYSGPNVTKMTLNQSAYAWLMLAKAQH